MQNFSLTFSNLHIWQQKKHSVNNKLFGPRGEVSSRNIDQAMFLHCISVSVWQEIFEKVAQLSQKCCDALAFNYLIPSNFLPNIESPTLKWRNFVEKVTSNESKMTQTVRNRPIWSHWSPSSLKGLGRSKN